MELKKIRCFAVMAVAAFWLLGASVCAAELDLFSLSGLRMQIPVGETQELVNVTKAEDGNEYAFLPAVANLNHVAFSYQTNQVTLFLQGDESRYQVQSGEYLDILPYCNADADGKWCANLVVRKMNGQEIAVPLYIMQSENIATMFISSADEAQKRDFVEADKKNAAKGNLFMVGADAHTIYAGELTQIKGRGNSTWGAYKKPYQIKLKNPTDLIETGLDENVNKTWVLLANAFDSTLLHNTIAYDLGRNMGIVAPDLRPVDVFYDGAYRGNYLLCEKVEVENGRVPAKDGYLIELDYWCQEEDYWFISDAGYPFTIKYPEKPTAEQVQYITDYTNAMINAAIAGGVNPDTGKSVWSYIDKNSLVNYYIHEEIVRNADAFVGSAYFYIPEEGSLMMAGPVWDYDDSFGVREDVQSAEGLFGADHGIVSHFMALPDFRRAVNERYKKVYPIAASYDLQAEEDRIAASQRMNDVLYHNHDKVLIHGDSFIDDLIALNSFYASRIEWLKTGFRLWK